jgi:hypothetical protein
VDDPLPGAFLGGSGTHDVHHYKAVDCTARSCGFSTLNRGLIVSISVRHAASSVGFADHIDCVLIALNAMLMPQYGTLIRIAPGRLCQ